MVMNKSIYLVKYGMLRNSTGISQDDVVTSKQTWQRCKMLLFPMKNKNFWRTNIGGSRGHHRHMPPPHQQVPILSFSHTFLPKSAHIGGRHPPTARHPPNRKSWMRYLFVKDSKNTQKVTDGHVAHLKDYLRCENKGLIEDLTDDELPDILFNFYSSAKPINGETYAIQTLKCTRAGLNRYIKKYRNIDIIQDCKFIRANEMFESVTVDAVNV